jgi:hypothetical protein
MGPSRSVLQGTDKYLVPIHLQLVLWSGIRGSAHSLPHTSSWPRA